MNPPHLVQPEPLQQGSTRSYTCHRYPVLFVTAIGIDMYASNMPLNPTLDYKYN